MKTLRLTIDLIVDDYNMGFDDADAKAWFMDLLSPDNLDLVLFDHGDFGDELGTVRIISVQET